MIHKVSNLLYLHLQLNNVKNVNSILPYLILKFRSQSGAILIIFPFENTKRRKSRIPNQAKIVALYFMLIKLENLQHPRAK